MKIPRSIKPDYPLHKLSHGSKVSWNFYSGHKAVVVSIGVLGTVGVILIVKFRDFFDLNTSDRRLAESNFWSVPGLQNLGNNCFLNVILQALSSGSGFRKYLSDIVEEFGSLPVEGEGDLPLVNSLTLLVEELCTVRHRRTVLSPRKVMLAMDHYIPNFNLTRQQDAEEAFSHLLSSLREEIAEQFVPEGSHLADLLSNRYGRVVTPKSSKEESESQRWSRMFLGPLDGILGSIIVCKSCSFQISLDFEMFPSLHLSPPISSDGAIMAGCTLEDCLKQFFVAEHLDNYCCSNCWHTAAIEYASKFLEDKHTVIEKLRHCNKNDPCDCKALSSLEAFPWSNGYCRAFKQLWIARSPKIFCLHLQRASYNMFGQSTKLQGHISFPSILDLSSFMNTKIVIKDLESNSRFPQSNRSRNLRYSPHLIHQKMLFNPEILNSRVVAGVGMSAETELITPQKRNVNITGNGLSEKDPTADRSLQNSGQSADDNVQMIVISPSAASRHQRYHLISVVEHFGCGGAGHYTVYRRVKAKIGDEDPAAILGSTVEQWFFISDSEVLSVSEKDVLGANATMLFYERIDDS